MDIKVITFDLDGVYFPNGKANFISAIVFADDNPDSFSEDIERVL